MNGIIVWLLIATSSTSYASTPVVIADFRTEEACLKASDELYQKAKDKRGMPNILSICLKVAK